MGDFFKSRLGASNVSQRRKNISETVQCCHAKLSVFT
jgi:hypothetical protein